MTASAPSCSLATELSETGVSAKLSVLPGDMAFSESELELLDATSFSGKGSLCFGDGPHSIELAATGPGRLESAGTATSMTGAITWHVQGGEGQFAGAKGFVTSVLTLHEDGQFSEYQTGVVYLADRV